MVNKWFVWLQVIQVNYLIQLMICGVSVCLTIIGNILLNHANVVEPLCKHLCNSDALWGLCNFSSIKEHIYDDVCGYKLGYHFVELIVGPPGTFSSMCERNETFETEITTSVNKPAPVCKVRFRWVGYLVGKRCAAYAPFSYISPTVNGIQQKDPWYSFSFKFEWWFLFHPN